jgi:L,D-transpeptidase YcbB
MVMIGRIRMRFCRAILRQFLDRRLQRASIAVLTALFFAGTAAQAGVPLPKPKGKPAASKISKAPKSPRISRSPEPTFDEGTAQRIAAAMLSYSALEVRGGWPSVPASVTKLGPGAGGPEVALLRERLAITDDLAPEHAAGEVFDESLAAALRRFQARHGLEQTGTVGPRTLKALNVPVTKRLRQLAASLDRIAEMDFVFGQKYVVVNIPAAVAEAVEGGKVARRHAVVVGKPDRPSPTLTTHITTVNLNPTWTVPLSILKKDIIPKMRRDPGYLARMHMRVLDGAGRDIDPRSIDWYSGHAPNFTVRQDPGRWNALGFVRFDMPNRYSVYMHDTNHRNLFSSDYRFHSSGCARLENPRDFAVWVLADNGSWSRHAIDAAITRGQRQNVRLKYQVPVAWVYLTGWVTRGGTIQFRDDIYHHDNARSRALVAELRPPISMAARASGFVLQSADAPPMQIKQVSYLDSQ